MTFSLEKLRNLQKSYKENIQTKELLSLLQDIKNNPQCIFDTNINIANDVQTILVNLLCHNESSIDKVTSISVKYVILDIFVEFLHYPELAWTVNENIGIISILFDEIQKQNEYNIYSKILQCLDLYIKFERSEIDAFGCCEGSCCHFGIKHRITPQKISSACCSIINLCLNEINNESYDGVDLPLIVLNGIYRHFNVNLSPETCGTKKVYDTFRYFLQSIFESKKYSSICVINALSCFLHCHDPNLNKYFNDTNCKYTLSIITDILFKCDRVDESAPSLYAITLLTDMLQQSHLVDLIQRTWTIENFKFVCKKFIGDYPAVYHETILSFFLAVKDKIVDWNSCLQRFLHTNCKLFTFVNQLTSNESDRCSLLAWRLMKTYFKSPEIPEVFSREYLSMVTNSIRYNLDKAFMDDKYHTLPGCLIGRRHLRAVKRCLESCEFLYLLLDYDSLSDQLINIFASAKMFAFINALADDLIKARHNQFVTLKPYIAESLAPLLCQTNTWFVSGARLVVSLMFVNVSMSQNYPDQVCIKAFEPVLMSDSFARFLAVCLSLSGNIELIERSVALVSYCSHLTNYNISLLSHLIETNNKFYTATCRSLAHSALTPGSIDGNLAILMSNCASLNNDTHHCTKHHEQVDKIINAWLSNQKSDFTSSETVAIFEDYVRGLKDRERVLETCVAEKDAYIRHCTDSMDEYRSQARNSDVTVQRLMTSVRSLNEALEGRSESINRMTDVVRDLEDKLSMVTGDLERRTREMTEMTIQLQDSEDKYARISKDFEGSEELNNQLRTLLTKSENENRTKDNEIKTLKTITETIQGLFRS